MGMGVDMLRRWEGISCCRIGLGFLEDDILIIYLEN